MNLKKFCPNWLPFVVVIIVAIVSYVVLVTNADPRCYKCNGPAYAVICPSDTSDIYQVCRKHGAEYFNKED